MCYLYSAISAFLYPNRIELVCYLYSTISTGKVSAVDGDDVDASGAAPAESDIVAGKGGDGDTGIDDITGVGETTSGVDEEESDGSEDFDEFDLEGDGK